MKKTIFLLALCGFWLATFAQPGSLLITSNNQRFWLFIDDILQNEYSVPSIRIQGMQFQEYKIRVEMDNRDANCIGQLIAVSNQSNRNSYAVSSSRNGYIISQIQSNMRPALTQNLIQPNYNYYNDYYQYMYPGFGNPGNYWQGSGGNGSQYNGGGRHHGGGNTQYPPQPPPPPPGGGYGNPGPCRNPMEFSTAMGMLMSESFESGKLQFAKNMTTGGPICVDQIIQVCRTFDFESTKLEYAKFAYPYCGDQNLYYLVNSVFDFQSSKDELGRFIR